MLVLGATLKLSCCTCRSGSLPWPPLPKLMVSVVLEAPPPPPPTTRFVEKLDVGEVAPARVGK